MKNSSYGDRFCEISGLTQAHAWQEALGREEQCNNRMIRIPTGFGKTMGVLSAWFFHRIVMNDDTWPRRLVWCLPMRVLVEQTEAIARSLVDKSGRLWDGCLPRKSGAVGVHQLMGGSNPGEWHLYPEECAILIGTQDMLLSRALNRGYAAPRARWPMEFGLLNQDCLWVMDEVQLMDVGLATSAQLQAFRDDCACKSLRPCKTWWMSATLQSDWLVSVDTQETIEAVGPPLEATKESLNNGLGKNTKEISLCVLADNKAIAKRVVEEHKAGQLTLVVFNRVEYAVEVAGQIRKNKDCRADIQLVHSRFRPFEREKWMTNFLNNQASLPPEGRIIVATQVVEAGVDISADLLITDLAPWPSLIQRFGRCARYAGEHGRIIVIDRDIRDDDEKNAAPYEPKALSAARECVPELVEQRDAGLGTLENFEKNLSFKKRKTLYPYDPPHLLLRREIEELFDTTPDLTGADIDISRFIRTGAERDVFIFWRAVQDKAVPDNSIEARRNELCPVSFFQAKKWLFENDAKEKRKWVWDYLEGAWRRCRKEDVFPGQTIFVELSAGGYDERKGWTGDKSDQPMVVEDASAPTPSECSDSAQERENLSQASWQTIREHGGDVARVLQQLNNVLRLSSIPTEVLELSGLWHDIGKAHSAFQQSIRHPQRPAGSDIAKAPKEAWKKPLYCLSDSERRAGFRHELATAMALLSVLERHNPSHPALLGPHRELLEKLGHVIPSVLEGSVSTPAEQELLALDDESFNLLLYLACSHHGKVRAAWHASPQDQDYLDRDGRGMPVRGIREGDRLPTMDFKDSKGRPCVLPAMELHLDPASIGLSPRTGASWTERTLSLQTKFGPFALAYLEALFRCADIRASRGLEP